MATLSAQYITIHSLKPQFYETDGNCASGNRALNCLGNFRKISESFLETVRVGTFLVFSRKFPRKCASGYVPPHVVMRWL